MPKRVFIVDSGKKPPQELAKALVSLFGKEQVDRLTKNGGLVKISMVTASWSTPQQVEPCSDYDDNTLARLDKFRDDLPSLQHFLERMPAKHLRETCRRMGIPFPSKTTAKELHSLVLDRIRTTNLMRKIEGHSNDDDSERKTPVLGKQSNKISSAIP